MNIKFEIEDLYDCNGDEVDVKSVLRRDIIDNISQQVLKDLSIPSYQLKQNAEKLIKENVHTFVSMGMERFLQEKCTTINEIIDKKISECFDSSDWNNEGLPNVIRSKIEKIIRKRNEDFDRMVTKMFEKNFKIVIEELLDVAFKQFVEKAGINTLWVSGRERIKRGENEST